MSSRRCTRKKEVLTNNTDGSDTLDANNNSFVLLTPVHRKFLLQEKLRWSKQTS